VRGKASVPTGEQELSTVFAQQTLVLKQADDLVAEEEFDAGERCRLIDLLPAPARNESPTADAPGRTVLVCSLSLPLLVDALVDSTSAEG
jgi:hypothetical protein